MVLRSREKHDIREQDAKRKAEERKKKKRLENDVKMRTYETIPKQDFNVHKIKPGTPLIDQPEMFDLCTFISMVFRLVDLVWCQICRCAEPMTEEERNKYKQVKVSELEDFFRIEECKDCGFEKSEFHHYIYSKESEHIYGQYIEE